MSGREILIVEDEQITAMEVQSMLEEMDYNVVGIEDTGKAALEVLEENSVDLVIMDIRLPGGMDGIETTRRINEEHDVPVIYFSAYSDDQTLEGARETEPAGFLIKPITKEDLRSSVEIALEKN
ncbi:MAG: response regulator [bacterium]